MTTPSHALVGSAVFTAPLMLTGPVHPALLSIAIYLVSYYSVKPDVDGWLWRLNHPGDWSVYNDRHHGATAQRMRKCFNLPYMLHLWIDRWFHGEALPKTRNWKLIWALREALIVASAILLWGACARLGG